MKTSPMSPESAAPGVDRTVDCGRYTTCLSSCMILTSAHAAASSKEPVIRPKWRYNDAMTAIDPSSHGVSPSALRVRRHRELCRGGRCLFTIEVPEANSNTRSRGLLKPEDRAESWPVIQAGYASQLSDAALGRLISCGMVTQETASAAASVASATLCVARV
jgi:hypothetical protein